MARGRKNLPVSEATLGFSRTLGRALLQLVFPSLERLELRLGDAKLSLNLAA